jgi:hypothetical protein
MIQTSMVTLIGPSTSISVMKGGSEEAFAHYLSWLQEYNPDPNADFANYPIRTETRIIQCRLKAKMLGLPIS